MTEVCHGVGQSWRAKFAGAVWASTVVVLDVFWEYHTQVPLTEDQHLVGEFVLTVRTNLSAKQFARGQRGGILTARMPTSARTASKEEFDWSEHSQAGMSPFGVVPAFYPLEDGVGKFVAGFPGSCVEDFEL